MKLHEKFMKIVKLVINNSTKITPNPDKLQTNLKKYYKRGKYNKTSANSCTNAKIRDVCMGWDDNSAHVSPPNRNIELTIHPHPHIIVSDLAS